MKRWIGKALPIGVLAAGFLIATGSAAQADNAGINNGNQTSTTTWAPVTVCGNAIALGGFADASCSVSGSGSGLANGTGGAWSTGNNAGIGNGNQTSTTVWAPVNVCGNAIALGGFASGSCAVDNGSGTGTGNSNGTGSANGTGHHWCHHSTSGTSNGTTNSTGTHHRHHRHHHS